jgi:hypothetical protein
MLLSLRETRDVPVIIYSVLERTDREHHANSAKRSLLAKDSDDRNLVRHVRSLLEGVPEATIRGDSWTDRFLGISSGKAGLGRILNRS